MTALPRAEALSRLATVAEAARMAAVESPEELAAAIDPRAMGRSRAARRRG
jgi:hypothetical protein